MRYLPKSDAERAQMLEACHRPDDATTALNQALRANPTRAELYRYATEFLLQKGRVTDALALLDRGAQIAHGNPNILLLQVVALEAAGKSDDAKRALKKIENRWPDWHEIWLARAIFEHWSGSEDRSRQALQTADALGATNAEQRYASVVKPPQPQGAERGTRLLNALFP